jgi:hypothetical protein
MTLFEVKNAILNYYTREDKLDLRIRNRHMWIYLRIMLIFQHMSKYYNVQICKKAFLDMFYDGMIFVEEAREMNVLLQHGILNDIITTLAILHFAKHQGIVS